MTRYEADREDLMGDAVALVRRAEFRVSDGEETVVAGYRCDGSLSIYFGQDPCYHFDAPLRLRRAFMDGFLYRTQGTTLARLQRLHHGGNVELKRHDLTPDELAQFSANLIAALTRLRASCCNNAVCLQAVPPGSDLKAELIDTLTRILDRPLALAPAIRGKK